MFEEDMPLMDSDFFEPTRAELWAEVFEDQNKVRRMVRSQEDRIAELESALRFYAGEDNYDNVQIGSAYISHVQMDGGERARIALYGKSDDEETSV
jgi:hypothetical protein